MVNETGQRTEAKQTAEKKTMGRPPTNVPSFPRDSLKASLAVAEAIRKDGAGKSLAVPLLANSLNVNRRGKPFENLLRSSERYGLTEGSVYSKEVVLKELGRAIVAPTDEALIGSSLRSALLTPDLFAKFYNYYDTKSIPRPEVVKNVLEQKFGVRRADVDASYNVLMKNVDEQSLKLQQKTDTLLWLDNLGKATATQTESGLLAPQPESGEVGEAPAPEKPTVQIPRPQAQVAKVPRVFISHSKNKKIVGQIKEMLEFGKFEHEVAEERETLAIPISEKVFGLMEKCNCAIINISADEEKKQKDASYAINENVLTEIGAAYLHYNRRVILLIDNRVVARLPSNIRELASIRYEGDELSWDAGRKLQYALSEFRNNL